MPKRASSYKWMVIEIQHILYPPEDPDVEWSPDTLDEIFQVLAYPPKGKKKSGWAYLTITEIEEAIIPKDDDEALSTADALDAVADIIPTPPWIE